MRWMSKRMARWMVRIHDDVAPCLVMAEWVWLGLALGSPAPVQTA